MVSLDLNYIPIKLYLNNKLIINHLRIDKFFLIINIKFFSYLCLGLIFW